MFHFGDAQSGMGGTGAASGNWADVIEMDFSHEHGAAQGGAWTEEIDGQKIVDGHVPADDHHAGSTHSDINHAHADHIDKLQW
jgi:hypothetical protein